MNVDIENCNYRQQIGEKFRLDKACNEKVDIGDVDISGVHCIFKIGIQHPLQNKVLKEKEYFSKAQDKSGYA